MDKDNNWNSITPVENKTPDSDQSIDWSMEVYNSAEYAQTRSVTPNYSTMDFFFFFFQEIREG